MLSVYSLTTVLAAFGAGERGDRTGIVVPRRIRMGFTSGFADGYDFRYPATLHGAEFLRKPYRSLALVSGLRKLLDRTAAGAGEVE